jgi:hypothetical protein
MAKRKYQRLTDEDRKRHAETQRMVQERIAYHEAKAREEEEARLRRGWLTRGRRRRGRK